VCDDVPLMTAALMVLGYAIGVLLILVIIRLEVTLDRKATKRVDYRLFISPDEVVELFKRNPVKQYFSARSRGQA
jgi:hypothetical protein